LGHDKLIDMSPNLQKPFHQAYYLCVTNELKSILEVQALNNCNKVK
jgi:hypothetical protein